MLATRSPALLASDWAQEQVKEQHGLDGMIVLVPVITERVDDNGGAPAEYQALVHLWDHIIETYHVDPGHVYGVGQSVGGMELLETNRNRDNGYSCRKPEATYEWLLSQSRQTAMAREKLDLNKPFAMAAEQLRTEERALHFTGREGGTIYYLTGKAGAGTQFYNTSWLNMATITDALPGWLPEGMSWETGVSGAHIVGVSALGGSALAIEYDTDMTGVVIHLKGDKVVSYFGNEREDDEILLNLYNPVRRRRR